MLLFATYIPTKITHILSIFVVSLSAHFYIDPFTIKWSKKKYVVSFHKSRKFQLYDWNEYMSMFVWLFVFIYACFILSVLLIVIIL